MRTYYINSLDDLEKYKVSNSGIILGFFDGFHVGHREIIEKAREENEKVAVLTFNRNIKRTGKTLFTLDERISIFESLRVKFLFIFNVDDHFIHITAHDFIEQYFKKFENCRFYAGEDFTFGYKAEGNVQSMIDAGLNVEVTKIVEDVNNSKISITCIKNLVEDGKIGEANLELAKPYFVKGKIVHGLNNGAKYVYPTINLIPEKDKILPKNGVYVTQVRIKNEIFNSVTNVGIHPTISKLSEPIIETYLLNFEREIYEESVEIVFYEMIREEILFEDVEKLKNQINDDISFAEVYFKYRRKIMHYS